MDRCPSTTPLATLWHIAEAVVEGAFEVPDDHASQACAYLRMLLVRPGEYRTLWEKHASPVEPGKPTYSAVAAVLADTSPVPAPDALAATVLDGRGLTSAQLELFIDAFGIRARHARRLRELLRGSATVRALSGGAAQDLAELGSLSGHETLSLHELHTVGPDGRPVEHETIQVIKARVDGLSSYPLRFDTDELVIEVVRGGRVGDHLYRVNEYLHGIDIVLDRPLSAGETALLQFHTSFAYAADPAPELRRGVLRSVDDLTVWVRFHPDRIPTHVWQARWDRIDQARVVDEAEAELDSEFSVHARFGAVSSAIVGFHWSFA